MSKSATIVMKTRTFRAAITLAFALLAAPAQAQTCREVIHESRSYAVCSVTVPVDLRLWLMGPDELPMGTFDRLRKTVTDAAGTLIFAMNAGMYHPDRRPVGLYIQDGAQSAPLVSRAGPGNFGMLPNGLFCIRADGFAVLESRAYEQTPQDCTFATQSGPMLVIAGALHPRFLPDATSLNIRNGVGVSADGQTAHFAISNEAVSFHQFARLFRDVLATPNALYFDGRVSRLYAPELDRDDGGFPMGPMVGLVTPAVDADDQSR